jgi:hypothetical protein
MEINSYEILNSVKPYYLRTKTPHDRFSPEKISLIPKTVDILVKSERSVPKSELSRNNKLLKNPKIST